MPSTGAPGKQDHNGILKRDSEQAELVACYHVPRGLTPASRGRPPVRYQRVGPADGLTPTASNLPGTKPSVEQIPEFLAYIAELEDAFRARFA